MMIAVIPARGGSKRIPRKNVRDFAGRPMIHWPIAAARESGVFARVIVSTDDAEIADVARAAGADVPALRPADLADDHTSVTAVVGHIGKTAGAGADWLCLVYATAALLRPDILAEAARRAAALPAEADYLISVCRHASSAQRALRFDGDRLEMIWPEHAMTRSQDLEPAHFDAAQFAFGRRSAWIEARPIWGAQTYGFTVNRATAVDIDEPDDWDIAERLAQLQAPQRPPDGTAP